MTAFPLPKEFMKFPAKGSGTAFGYQRSSSHVHQGIDLFCPKRTPVFAVASGEVVSARKALNPSEGKKTGAGRNIVLKHTQDALFHSWYMHLDELLVKPGEQVTMGQQIGWSGNSMFSDLSAKSPHLHFEILTKYPPGGEPPGGGVTNRVDPEQWLTDTYAAELGQVKKKRGGGLLLGLLLLLVGSRK